MTVTCPECGTSRDVGYAAEWLIRTGRNSGACHACAMVARRRAPEARFWAKVDKRGPDKCWPWLGVKGTKGHGRFYAHGSFVPAYRFSYELVHGPIAEGLEMDHLCFTPECVNPAHLEPVSHTENVRRGARRIEQCRHGHPYDEANTYFTRRGHRQCRACRREGMRETRCRT